MEETYLKKASGLLNTINNLEDEIKVASTYKGNKWWIGFGQDHGHGKSVSANDGLFNAVIATIIKVKKQQLDKAKQDFENM